MACSRETTVMPSRGLVFISIFVFWDSIYHCFKPGLAPAGATLSFASPRESKQREGEPDSSPGFAGKLRCSGLAGFAQTRFAQTYAPLIRQTLRYSPSSLRRGGTKPKKKTQLKCKIQ